MKWIKELILKLLSNDLTKSVGRVKNIYVQIIIFSSITIILSLVTALVYKDRKNETNDNRNYNAVVAEGERKDKIIDSLIRVCAMKDSRMLDYVQKDLDNEREKKEVKIYIDSVEKQVDKLNHTLK